MLNPAGPGDRTPPTPDTSAEGRPAAAGLQTGASARLQEAINQRDYPVVQGIVVVIAALVVLVSVAVDLLVASLDPRVRY